MSTYKVIQDIEAEDKILGPLTLRQFIFALIFALFGYLTFIFVSKSLWPLVLFSLPGMFVFGLLAFPWHRDQPTEIWLGSRLRFLFKPRLRIWDQQGIDHLVSITAPKKAPQNLTKNLNPNEVTSRLSALALTLDTRGWATKHIHDQFDITTPSFVTTAVESNDRLVELENIPHMASAIADGDHDDMFVAANPVSQQFDTMMRQTAEQTRNRAIASMQQVTQEAGFSPLPTYTAAPINTQPQPTITSVQQPSPAIIGLAQNDTFSIATLAQEAKRQSAAELTDNNTVSLR